MASRKNARVSGRTAAAHAGGSAGSAKVTSMPKSANVSVSRSTVPPYSWLEATRCLPPCSSASRDSATAAWPVAVAIAPMPPSSAARRFSNTATVGLPVRL